MSSSLQQRRVLATSVLLLLLCHMTAVLASTAAATATAPMDASSDHLAWQGAWHFEPSWFVKQHPWLPKFVVNKALSSTLLLDHSGYHQLDDEGKPLKQKRPLRIVSLSPEKALLVRTEGRKKEVEFHLEKRQDNHVYYCEGKSSYRLLRPTTWAQEVTEEVEQRDDASSVVDA